MPVPKAELDIVVADSELFTATDIEGVIIIVYREGQPFARFSSVYKNAVAGHLIAGCQLQLTSIANRVADAYGWSQPLKHARCDDPNCPDATRHVKETGH